MSDISGKLTKKQVLAAITGGFAFVAACNLSYFISYYYAVYQAATGFTDGQIGEIMSLVGIAATISYILGGPLADKYRPKVLLIICCVSTSIASLGMLLYPSFTLMKVIHAVIAVCALLPHWMPLTKFMSLQSSDSKTLNKMWGIYSGVCGVLGLAIGLIASALASKIEPKTCMTVTVFMNIFLNVITVILILTVDKSKRGDAVVAGEKFDFKEALKLLVMPKTWIMWITAIGIYLAAFALTYTTPLMTSVFGVSVATATLINTLSANLKIVTGPISGGLAAKFGSCLKANLLLYGIGAVGLILLLVFPWGPGSIAIILVSVAILAFAYRSSTTYWGPIHTDSGIPISLIGTSSGLLSVVMTIPDTFIYTLGGRAAERGEAGFRSIFMWVLVCFAVGAAANIALIAMRKKEQAKETAESKEE